MYFLNFEFNSFYKATGINIGVFTGHYQLIQHCTTEYLCLSDAEPTESQILRNHLQVMGDGEPKDFILIPNRRVFPRQPGRGSLV